MALRWWRGRGCVVGWKVRLAGGSGQGVAKRRQSAGKAGTRPSLGPERAATRPQPALRNADLVPPSTLLWKLFAADHARGSDLAQHA